MEKFFSILRIVMVLFSLSWGMVGFPGCGEGGTEIGNPTGPIPTDGPANGEGDPAGADGEDGDEDEEPSEEEENPENEPTIQGGGS